MNIADLIIAGACLLAVLIAGVLIGFYVGSAIEKTSAEKAERRLKRQFNEIACYQCKEAMEYGSDDSWVEH